MAQRAEYYLESALKGKTLSMVGASYRGWSPWNPKFTILLAALSVVSIMRCMPLRAEERRYGGTLIYLEQQAHTNLYPPAGGFYANGGILAQITDRLTWQDPATLTMKPWLATSWDVNDDNTIYTFHLRSGVSFSDGAPLDAKAVALNFDTFGKGNRQLHLAPSEAINGYDHSEVIDPLTVRFFFKNPAPGFLQGTSVIGSGIVSPATLSRSFDELGKATNIVGSGPFVVANEVPGKEIDLVVRKGYRWAPAGQPGPFLDGVKILVTPEDSIRIGALLSGQADLIRQVQAYDEEQVTLQKFTLYAPSTRGVNTELVFRPDNPIVADLRVRQALLYATNRNEIISTLYSSNYPIARSVLAAQASGFVDLSNKLGYDPGKAAQLLDEAGWRTGADGLRYRNGQPLILGIHESLPHPQNRTMLELIAQQWRKLGVTLNIMSGTAAGIILDNLNPERTPVSVSEVGRADPDVLKSEFYPTNRDLLLQKGGQSSKVKSFYDATLVKLLQRIADDTNPQDRLAVVGEVQRYIVDSVYTIPIFEEPQVYAAAPYVKGLMFEAVGRPVFLSVSLNKP